MSNEHNARIGVQRAEVEQGLEHNAHSLAAPARSAVCVSVSEIRQAHRAAEAGQKIIENDEEGVGCTNFRRKAVAEDYDQILRSGSAAATGLEASHLGG